MFSGILKYREKDLGKIWSLFDLLKLGIKMLSIKSVNFQNLSKFSEENSCIDNAAWMFGNLMLKAFLIIICFNPLVPGDH